ncbi:MAG: hypothetical protein WC243_02450, partial [Patescibacteria group bacterium]
MEKLRKILFSHWSYILAAITFFIYAALIINNNAFIGGDVMIPMVPGNVIKRIFTWWGGGEVFHYFSALWFLFYYAMSLLGVSAIYTHKILILALPVAGFVFTRKTYKTLFKNTDFGSDKLATVAAFVFTYNPVHLLVMPAYLPLFGFPICMYVLLKFLEKKNPFYALVFSITFNFFFLSELPQAKMSIVFAIAVFFLALLYSHVQNVRLVKIFYKLVVLFVITFLLNLWLLLPLIHSFLHGGVGSFSKNLSTFSGGADFGIASLIYIMRFYNWNIPNFYPKIGMVFSSWLFNIFSWFFWLVSIAGAYTAMRKKDKGVHIIAILLLFVLFFIFIAKGSNPPFGFVYRGVLSRSSFLGMFRTTSSVAIAAAMFFSFLVPISAYFLSFQLKHVFRFITLLCVAISFPIYFGYKFHDTNNTDSGGGYKIPDQYFEIGRKLDEIEGNSKVLSLPLIKGYVSKKWGYFGPDIVSWITKSPVYYRSDMYGMSMEDDSDSGSYQGVYENTSLSNIGYILLQKDSVPSEKNGSGLGEPFFENKYFDLIKVSTENFLPVLYVPSLVVNYSGVLSDVFSVMHSLYAPKELGFSLVDKKFSREGAVSDNYVLEAEKLPAVNPYLTLKRTKDLVWPDASVSPDSAQYALVRIKEKIEMLTKRSLQDRSRIGM